MNRKERWEESEREEGAVREGEERKTEKRARAR